jgi:hypothetical protein
MPRTTIDLDASVLRELKRRSQARGTTVGRLASELLVRALRQDGARAPAPLEWRTAPMHALVDLRDEEALHRALDGR